MKKIAQQGNVASMQSYADVFLNWFQQHAAQDLQRLQDFIVEQLFGLCGYVADAKRGVRAQMAERVTDFALELLVEYNKVLRQIGPKTLYGELKLFAVRVPGKELEPLLDSLYLGASLESLLRAACKLFTKNAPNRALVQLALWLGAKVERSSGVPSWDDAVLRAVQRLRRFPSDHGTWYTPMEIKAGPRDAD